MEPNAQLQSQLSLYRKALPQQVTMREIVRLLRSTEGKTCLDIGLNNPFMSRGLRKLGGKWATLVTDPAAQAGARELVGDGVDLFDGHALPFPDKSFDVVVMSNFLERVKNDVQIICECHRIIAATGVFAVCVPHAKRWSLLRPVEVPFGLTFQRRGWVRAGYSEVQLFQLLKDGFDVHSVRSFQRAFVQLVDDVVHAKASRLANDRNRDARLLRLYSRAYPFYLLAFHLLDVPLFFTAGYNLIALARRHAWRPRKAPVLADGRSISEAVLSVIKR